MPQAGLDDNSVEGMTDEDMQGSIKTRTGCELSATSGRVGSYGAIFDTVLSSAWAELCLNNLDTAKAGVIMARMAMLLDKHTPL